MLRGGGSCGCKLGQILSHTQKGQYFMVCILVGLSQYPKGGCGGRGKGVDLPHNTCCIRVPTVGRRQLPTECLQNATATGLSLTEKKTEKGSNTNRNKHSQGCSLLHGRGTFSKGWRLAVGGSWWLVVGGWWWLAAVGSWWQLAVGGPWGLSLRAVVDKKDIGVLKVWENGENGENEPKWGGARPARLAWMWCVHTAGAQSLPDKGRLLCCGDGGGCCLCTVRAILHWLVTHNSQPRFLPNPLPSVFVVGTGS